MATMRPTPATARDRLPIALAVVALGGLVAASPSPRAAWAKPPRAGAHDADPPKKAHARRADAGRCAPQKPQSFLVRSSFVKHNRIVPGALARAIRYRTEQYGYVEGFGDPGLNEHEPSYYGEATTFFGLPIRMHRKVVPALSCVEAEITRTCAKTPYQPGTVGGFRDHNTYRGGEVTNHLYGIAIDIDPERNPCCHCVEPWGNHPACQGERKTVYERMQMPRCWVEAFERFGFYWLGHDRLQDTMHFEFLGKPEKILR